MRLKRPARLNIGVDLDSESLARFGGAGSRSGEDLIAGSGDARSTNKSGPELRLLQADALDFLGSYCWQGGELVYCDPPYMRATRTRDLYRYEMTDGGHIDLLRLLKRLPCAVMISGYWTRLYSHELKGWASVTFEAMTRGGTPRTEWLWSNFPEPVALHDYAYLGSDFRERERIKRKKNRWAARLSRMPLLERRALLSAIGDTVGFGDAAAYLPLSAK